jgi:hypothetical protein
MRSVTCSGDLLGVSIKNLGTTGCYTCAGPVDREKGGDSLSTRTAVPPDIPSPHQAVPPPDVPDLGRRDALVVAVVPLADVLRDLDLGSARVVGQVIVCDTVPVPGQWLVLLPDAEELEGALGALPGGDVAVICE